MNSTSTDHPNELIRKARIGESRAMNTLIDVYRPYLKLLARLQHDARLTAKLDESDLVQEVSTLAIRDFPSFQGCSECEFTGWLRTMMAHVAAKSVRHYTTQRRDVRLERELQLAIDQSSCLVSDRLAGQTKTPSEQVLQRERSVLIAEALEQLPDHYREVIILRDFEGLTPKQIAERIDRTPDAVCKIWARALGQVRRLLEGKV